MTEPLFYRNCVGAVALSVDDGETVWIPQGRNIPLTPAWKWTDEDGLEACLNDVQTKALEHARNAPPLSDLEQMAEKLRKGQLKTKKDYRQSRVFRQVSESVLVVKSDPDD